MKVNSEINTPYIAPFEIPRGVKVVINDMACIYTEYKQFRFPKSKKKRIRKKWSKRARNWKTYTRRRVLIIRERNLMFVSTEDFMRLKELAENPAKLSIT